MPRFKFQKAVQVINFFAQKEPNGTINKMKALKLIWLSDRCHLRQYGRPILNDSYVAMKYGPVASGSRDLLEGSSWLQDQEAEYRSRFIQNVGPYDIRSRGLIDSDYFSETDELVMDAVHSAYAGNGQFELSDISHMFPEWNKFEQLLKSAPCFPMSMEDFFINPVKPFPLFNESALKLKLNKDKFAENRGSNSL